MNINENTVLVGGITSYGSGIVIKNIMKNFFHNAEIINTSKMNLYGVLRSIKTIKNKDIYFHPSIAGFSWIRDLILSKIIDFYGNNKSTIILCDLEYTKFNFIAKPIIKNFVIKNSNRVFLPADINAIETKLYKEAKYELHHIISKNNNLPKKVGDIIYTYANYLTKDKGIDQFLKIFKDGIIIGSGKILKDTNSNKIFYTSSKTEFDKVLKKLSNKRLIFCYLSKFDLSPILIQEMLVLGIVIGVFRGSKSEEILNNQFYDIDYIYLDDVLKNSFSHEAYDKISNYNYVNFLNYKNKIIHSSDHKKVYISI